MSRLLSSLHALLSWASHQIPAVYSNIRINILRHQRFLFCLPINTYSALTSTIPVPCSLGLKSPKQCFPEVSPGINPLNAFTQQQSPEERESREERVLSHNPAPNLTQEGLCVGARGRTVKSAHKPQKLCPAVRFFSSAHQ